MPTIHLDKLIFFSFHGLHPEEQRLGTEFEVSVDIDFNAQQPIQSIDQTIDYTMVYGIVKERMAKPTALLETVAEEMAASIIASNAMIAVVSVRISKIHAPISNFSGKVGVSIVKKADH